MNDYGNDGQPVPALSVIRLNTPDPNAWPIVYGAPADVVEIAQRTQQGEWVTLDSPAPDAAGGAGPSPVMVRWSWVTSVMQVPEHQAIEHLNSVMS